MGFLNNTTVTVDAILTKKGRELLAQGTEAFNITKFALADDEVDYNLWDVTHPNGSDSYGKVIENMPLLEAFPDENHVMRYKLITLPKSTARMPSIQVSTTAHIFPADGGVNQNITISPQTSRGTDSSYTFILHDQSVVSMEVFPQGNAATSVPFFLGEDDVPNSLSAAGTTCTITALTINKTAATQVTIVGNDTGVTESVTITNKLTFASQAAVGGAGAFE